MFLSQLATILVIGLVSIEFFAVWISVIATVSIVVLAFVIFRKKLESYYGWFEEKFVSGIAAEHKDHSPRKDHQHLVPWDARLAEVSVPPNSSMIGQTLAELQMRERFEMNVVVIQRAGDDIVAPKATEHLYPGDNLLCFGTDDALERFHLEVEASRPTADGAPKDILDYGLRQIVIGKDSAMNMLSIKDSGIRELFDCMVVGIERKARRIQSPKSDLKLHPDDLLWVVGEKKNLHRLAEHFL